MSVSKNLTKTEFLKMKTSTSTRMGHVGEQTTNETEIIENENVDVNKDLAFQVCRNLKTWQNLTNFDEIENFP